MECVVLPCKMNVVPKIFHHVDLMYNECFAQNNECCKMNVIPKNIHPVDLMYDECFTLQNDY